MMMRPPVLRSFFLFFMICSPALADYAKGVEAYRNGEYQKALKEWKAPARDGNREAQFNLGLLHYKGQGTTKNYKTALSYFSQAAKQGHIRAQFNIGVMFHAGQGVKKSHTNAFKWYSLSANQGLADAQAALGNMYRVGTGVAQSDSEAVKWLKLSANQGHKLAKRLLASMDAEQRLKPSNDQAPEIVYKGRRLIGSTYPKAKNDMFFSFMKKAIDKTESLPADLQKKIEIIREIWYDPPSKLRPRNDAYTNTTGVYSIDMDSEKAAPVIVYRDVKWLAPIELAYSLVGNSVSAERHMELIGIKRQLRKLQATGSGATSEKYKTLKRRHDDIIASIEKTDLDIVQRFKCKNMRAHFIAAKAWDKSSPRTSALAQELSLRKCL